jgi:hypothetical protein
MPRDLTVLLTCVALMGGVGSASAQTVPSAAIGPVHASVGEGRLLGVVTDEGGQTIGGVSILAMGTSLAAVTTDGQGRFSLRLPIGEYVLRAAREGYISTYREPVRVQTDVTLERRIRLVHAGAADSASLGPASAPPSPAAAEAAVEPAAPSDIAWRLRHIERTVLRDEGFGAPWGSGDDALPRVARVRDGAAGVDRGMGLLSNADLSGQLNVFTTQSLELNRHGAPPSWPAGAADVILGAPVGSYGEWSARGVMAASNLSSWMVLGEFRSRTDQRHAVRVGLSYSTQTLGDPGDPALSFDSPATRSVGGVHAADRWQLSERLDLEYGVRIDRYDYLNVPPDLVSPRAGVRWRFAGATAVVASVHRRAVAPGADEFLPPTSPGLWLPAERTFAPLVRGSAFRPERQTGQTLGLEHTFRQMRPIVVRVAWFSEDTTDQIATIFGLDRASTTGQYYVAPIGSVAVAGWKARVSGSFTPHVSGSLEYVSARANWRPGQFSDAVRGLAPSALGRRDETLADLTGSLDISVPESGTDVTFAYRLSNAFSVAADSNDAPVPGARVKLEVHQLLPYQPLRNGRLNLLFAIRTLLHDDEGLRSLYDELLTVTPPLRLTGGVQVLF